MPGFTEFQPPYRPLNLAELNPPMNATLVVDGAGLAKLSKFIERLSVTAVPTLGHDTETNVVVDFWNRRVRTIQLGDKLEQ